MTNEPKPRSFIQPPRQLKVRFRFRLVTRSDKRNKHPARFLPCKIIGVFQAQTFLKYLHCAKQKMQLPRELEKSPDEFPIPPSPRNPLEKLRNNNQRRKK